MYSQRTPRLANMPRVPGRVTRQTAWCTARQSCSRPDELGIGTTIGGQAVLWLALRGVVRAHKRSDGMAREKSRTGGAVLRPLAERAIIETLEQAESPAEGVTEVDPDLRREMVATTAYFIAEQHGFLTGPRAKALAAGGGGDRSALAKSAGR